MGGGAILDYIVWYQQGVETWKVLEFAVLE